MVEFELYINVDLCLKKKYKCWFIIVFEKDGFWFICFNNYEYVKSICKMVIKFFVLISCVFDK